MREPLLLDGVFQRLRDVFLADDLVEGLRTVFAGEDFVAHGWTENLVCVRAKQNLFRNFNGKRDCALAARVRKRLVLSETNRAPAIKP